MKEPFSDDEAACGEQTAQQSSSSFFFLKGNLPHQMTLSLSFGIFNQDQGRGAGVTQPARRNFPCLSSPGCQSDSFLPSTALGILMASRTHQPGRRTREPAGVSTPLGLQTTTVNSCVCWNGLSQSYFKQPVLRYCRLNVLNTSSVLYKVMSQRCSRLCFWLEKVTMFSIS